MLAIGERINGMYKDVAKALQNKDKAAIQDLAKRQIEAGADALDLNCGPASKDQISDLKWLIETTQEVTDKILSIDSSKPSVIEAVIKTAKNKTIINSASADQEKLDILVPLAKENNSLLIALAMSKKGIPHNKDQRIELAATIAAACQDKGFPLDHLYIDPVVMPVDCAQAQLKEILESIREFKMLSDPPVKTVVGLSNISQGMKDRSLVNRIFLVMGQTEGLDAAILDPLDTKLMDEMITAELILNKQIYCKDYIDAYKKSKR